MKLVKLKLLSSFVFPSLFDLLCQSQMVLGQCLGLCNERVEEEVIVCLGTYTISHVMHSKFVITLM